MTILEMILALALVSIVIILGTNLFVLGDKTQKKTINEYDIQSNIRIVSQTVNGIIRDASGLFLLNKEYPSDVTMISTHFTKEWNYLMLNKDKTKVIEWVWDGEKHVERTIVDSLNDVTYSIEFIKSELSDENNILINKDNSLLKYILSVSTSNKPRGIESELDGVNTLQIIDRSYGLIANTISYRSDPRIRDIGVAEAAVSFVIDTSGSMAEELNPGTRLSVLKEEAKNMIDGFAEYENVNLSITPFSDKAYNKTGYDLNQMLSVKPDITKLKNIIDNLEAKGWTNTGDGMRRGFYTIKDYNAKTDDKLIKNFMIILVDGESNRAGQIETIDSNKQVVFTNNPPNHIVNGSEFQNYKREIGLFSTKNTFYYKKGSDLKTYDKPLKPHTVNYEDGIEYTFDDWDGGGWWAAAKFIYKYKGTPFTLILDDHGFETSKVVDTNVDKYIQVIGSKIQEYKNKREDGIETFVIGFTNDISPQGLQKIANSTNATNGTHGSPNKYYIAATQEALEAVLDEIKFQISTKLWHIGGPN